MSEKNNLLICIFLSALCCTAVRGDKTDLRDTFSPPPDKDYDWIQLSSGEWLKGELKVMYNYTLEFDSDELDLLELDFDDVRQIRTGGSQQLLIESGPRETTVQRGRLELHDEKVRLIGKSETNTYARYQVVSIAGGARGERDKWSGFFSVGATARGGNTETTDITAQSNIRRRTAMTRLNLDYLANYSEAQRTQTADNQRLSGYFDWFLTSRFYWQVVSGEYFRDPFSNIDNQYSVSTGIGYDLVRSSKTEWTLGAGVGYQSQEFVSVQPGEDRISQSAFGTMGTRLDREINESTDFLYEYNIRFLNKDNGRYTHHMLAKLSFDLVGDFDLDVSVLWTRIEKPKADQNGNLPKRDDYQMVVGLAYDF